MFDGEFTHAGDRCTFETLLDRFALTDPALRAIAEIVHDISPASLRPTVCAVPQPVASGLRRPAIAAWLPRSVHGPAQAVATHAPRRLKPRCTPPSAERRRPMSSARRVRHPARG